MAYIAICHSKEKTKADFIEKSRQLTQVPGVNTAEFVFDSPQFKGIIQIRKEIAPDFFKENYHENDKYVVFIDGYVSEGQGKNDAGHVLESFIEKGDDFVENLNGEYHIVIYNWQKNEVKIFTDRFAARPFFYHSDGKEFMASNEIKTILSHIHKNISSQGFLEFFLFFHNLQEKTIYKGVKSILPASILTANGAGLKAKQYWNVSFKTSGIKVNDYAAEIKHVLESGAEKRYINRKMIGLGLSGGLDSRLIAASIPDHIKKDVFVRTYGAKGSREIDIASQLVEKLHFKEHYIHEPGNVSFSDFIFSSVWRTEGQIPFFGLKSITQHKFLKDKMHYNLPGHFGDVLTGKSLRPYMFVPMTRHKFIHNFFYKTIKLNLDTEIKQVINIDYFEKYFPIVRQNFIKSFKDINASNNYDLASIWDLNNRQTRFTFQSGQVDSYIQEPIKLFTDYNYVDLMTSLPLYLRFAQVFYKYMIANSFSEIGDVVNDNTGVILKKTILGNYFDMYDLIKTGVLRRRKRSSTKQSSVFANTRQDEQLKSYLINFINDSTFPNHLLDKNGIIKIIDEHYNRVKDHNYIVGMLSTFFATYDLFIVNNYTSIPDRSIPF